MAKTWGKIGRELTEKLDGADEATIQVLGKATLRDILTSEATYEGQSKALKMINRELLKTYPRLEKEAPNYWHDANGRVDAPKWRHLIFKSLTLRPATETQAEPELKPEIKTTQPLKTMTIQQLDLDYETQEVLENALQQSGMDLEGFIKQAIKIYAKTVTGRNKSISADLANVLTSELLDSPKYRTHPGRAVELTKRAIVAIKSYNSEIATENSQRWMITASAIASLIGSRQSTIKEIMQQFQTSIDENNLNPEWDLTPYSNRKAGKNIDNEIQLSGLVPDGI